MLARLKLSSAHASLPSVAFGRHNR
jgi:hypothetical protein